MTTDLEKRATEYLLGKYPCLEEGDETLELVIEDYVVAHTEGHAAGVQNALLELKRAFEAGRLGATDFEGGFFVDFDEWYKTKDGVFDYEDGLPQPESEARDGEG